MRSITYGEKGSAFILSKDGVLIADDNSENVKNGINFGELEGNAAELEADMISKDTGSRKPISTVKKCLRAMLPYQAQTVGPSPYTVLFPNI